MFVTDIAIYDELLFYFYFIQKEKFRQIDGFQPVRARRATSMDFYNHLCKIIMYDTNSKFLFEYFYRIQGYLCVIKDKYFLSERRFRNSTKKIGFIL